MLELYVEEAELYDEAKNVFIELSASTLQLEHSLVSLYEWEGQHRKPLLSKDPLTVGETIDYIRCMTLNDVDENVYKVLTNEHISQVNSYIDLVPTATTFPQTYLPNSSSGEGVTAELIYYWMFSYHIPKECETWNLNRLITLIKIFDRKNSPGKKMSKAEIYKRNSKLNAARRAAMHSRG